MQEPAHALKGGWMRGNKNLIREETLFIADFDVSRKLTGDLTAAQ
jgi:hypothetical protein